MNNSTPRRRRGRPDHRGDLRGAMRLDKTKRNRPLVPIPNVRLSGYDMVNRLVIVEPEGWPMIKDTLAASAASKPTDTWIIKGKRDGEVVELERGPRDAMVAKAWELVKLGANPDADNDLVVGR